MLRRALPFLLVLPLLGGLTPPAPSSAATAPPKKKECRKPLGKDKKKRKRCGAAGRRGFKGLGSTGRYILGGASLEGTFTSVREEDGSKYEAFGKMSYKGTPVTRADLDRMGDIKKPWDWDLDGGDEWQVGEIRPVAYTGSTSAHVYQKEHTWDCSFTYPAHAVPRGITGLLHRVRKDKWKVQWTFVPPAVACGADGPEWGFEPLPSEAMYDEFDRLLIENDPHPTLPIDIDHRWTDGAGSHRITWKGHIGLVSLDLVMDHKCRSLCTPADLDELEALGD